MSPIQLRMARAGLKWSADHLAKQAKLGWITVQRFEDGKPVRKSTVDAIETVLVKAGVLLIGQDGVRIPPKQSQRGK